MKDFTRITNKIKYQIENFKNIKKSNNIAFVGVSFMGCGLLPLIPILTTGGSLFLGITALVGLGGFVLSISSFGDVYTKEVRDLEKSIKSVASELLSMRHDIVTAPPKNIKNLAMTNVVMISLFQQKIAYLNSRANEGKEKSFLFKEEIKKLEERKQQLTKFISSLSVNEKPMFELLEESQELEKINFYTGLDYTSLHNISKEVALTLSNFGVVITHEEGLTNINIQEEEEPQLIQSAPIQEKRVEHKSKIKSVEPSVEESPEIFKTINQKMQLIKNDYANFFEESERQSYKEVEENLTGLIQSYNLSKNFKNKEQFLNLINESLTAMYTNLDSLREAVEQRLLKEVKIVSKVENNKKMKAGK